MTCKMCGREVEPNAAGNLPRHMRPEIELAWRVCTPSVNMTLAADWKVRS